VAVPTVVVIVSWAVMTPMVWWTVLFVRLVVTVMIVVITVSNGCSHESCTNDPNSRETWIDRLHGTSVGIVSSHAALQGEAAGGE
jgi:hypothetical protein